jgi:DNA-binding transcriptional regulator YiaG
MGGKELIDQACNELNSNKKELAELIGANSGTLMNWSSKNEVPLWAEKSITRLIDYTKCKRMLSTMKDLNSYLTNKEVLS